MATNSETCNTEYQIPGKFELQSIDVCFLNSLYMYLSGMYKLSLQDSSYSKHKSLHNVQKQATLCRISSLITGLNWFPLNRVL